MKYVKLQCDCEDWEEGIQQIYYDRQMALIHGSPEFHGKFFVYCPWCGKKLERIVLEDKDV